MTTSDLPEYYPKCKEAALTAIRLDEKNSLAHGLLAFVLWSYERDTAGSEKEFKRAIELDPNGSHNLYALFLAGLGRSDEAIREIRQAEANDPLNVAFKSAVGNIYFNARQYDRAMEQFKTVIESHPDFSPARLGLARVYAFKGRHEEAIAETQKFVALSKGDPASDLDLAWAYAMARRRSEATKILNAFKKLPTSGSARRMVKVATVYAALGDKEQAFVWLEKAFALHAGGLQYLKTDPFWDDMRPDPRFQDLMRRVGLPA